MTTAGFVSIHAIAKVEVVDKLAPLINALAESIVNDPSITQEHLDTLRDMNLSPEHLAWGKLLEYCASADLDWLRP